MKDGLMYFRLIGGGHVEGCLKNNNFIEYKKGDIVESDIDLEKKFGSKFKRILDGEKYKGKENTSKEHLIPPKDSDIECIGEKKLSILICSLRKRRCLLERLLKELERQHHKSVEILVEVDNRNISTGAKRNLLLEKAKGDYIAFIDDDDMVSENYIAKILWALQENPDCCSLEGILFRPKQRFLFYHTIKCKRWHEKDNIYYRTPNHLNAVKRELALQTKFLEINRGEDVDYSTRLRPLLKTEVLRPLLKTEAHIEGVLYYYIKDKKWIRP